MSSVALMASKEARASSSRSQVKTRIQLQGKQVAGQAHYNGMVDCARPTDAVL
jgi:hypothetical protein